MPLRDGKVRFILLNGPPQSGKTRIARVVSEYLRAHGVNVVGDSFAAPMKNYIAYALGERYDELKKDAPHPVLRGFTPREFLISESEEHMKPKYGSDIYGRLLYHRVMRLSPLPDIVMVDDCGFKEEGEVLGEYDPILVKIVRPGYDFTNDSRSYWFDGNEHYTIVNDSDLPTLNGYCQALASAIIYQYQ